MISKEVLMVVMGALIGLAVKQDRDFKSGKTPQWTTQRVLTVVAMVSIGVALCVLDYNGISW